MAVAHLVLVVCGVLQALCAVTGAPAAAPSPAAAKDAGPVTIVCFGDSITFGYHLEDREKDCYPAVLQARLDEKYGHGAFKVVNAGVSGQDSRQCQKRLDAVLDEYEPAWMLVELGTNDLWDSRKLGPEETRRNLTEIIRKIRLKGASVVMATLPPVWEYDEKVAGRNRVIKEVAAATKVTLVDLNAAFEKAFKAAGGRDKKSSWLKYYIWEDEFVHPNPAGYRLAVDKWLAGLEAAMKRKQLAGVQKSQS